MKRVTARKKFRATLAAFKQWLKGNRTKMTTRDLGQKVHATLRGHYAYYGVPDSSPGIHRFFYEVTQLLFKWLNRRGGKRRMTWEEFVYSTNS